MIGGRQGGQGRIHEQGRNNGITDTARDFALQLPWALLLVWETIASLQLSWASSSTHLSAPQCVEIHKNQNLTFITHKSCTNIFTKSQIYSPYFDIPPYRYFVIQKHNNNKEPTKNKWTNGATLKHHPKSKFHQVTSFTNICTFWNIEQFIHPSPKFCHPQNMNFLTEQTQKAGTFLGLTLSQPKEVQTDQKHPKLNLILKQVLSTCFLSRRWVNWSVLASQKGRVQKRNSTLLTRRSSMWKLPMGTSDTEFHHLSRKHPAVLRSIPLGVSTVHFWHWRYTYFYWFCP